MLIDAAPLFREKKWDALERALALDAEKPSGVEARLLVAWCHLERGQRDSGLEFLRRVLSERLDDWALERPWGLWPLRKRFGPSALLEWGVHELVLARAWALTHDASLPAIRTGFIDDWVGRPLQRFMATIPEGKRPPTPWQLGGSGAVITEERLPALRDWLAERLQVLVTLSRDEREVAQKLLRHDPALVTELRRRAQELPDETTAMRLLLGLANKAPVDELLALFGEVLAVRGGDVTAVAREVDAVLLVEDVRGRLPPEAKRHAGKIERVLFRATPRRVVDAAVVQLAGGEFGSLARHVVPKDGDATGKVEAHLAWVHGALDEVLAALPEVHFANAVEAVKAFAR